MNYWKALLFTALGLCASAQTSPSWDASGNNQLYGSYHFRHIAYVTSDLGGDTSKKFLLYGEIRFDGQGNYAVTGSQVDARAGAATLAPVTYTGTYAIAASGYGYLTNPVVKNALIYGSVSSGIFLGASTESGFIDLLIAAPARKSTARTLFTGRYDIAAFDVPSNDHKAISNFSFALTPCAHGRLGPISITGYVAGDASLVTGEVSATYSLLEGVGNIAISPAETGFLSGDQIFYLSRDGTFVFGGSPTTFNMFVGVQASYGDPAPKTFSGLYYQAGLDHDASAINSKNRSVLSSYHGSLIAADGTTVNHQRLNALIYPTALDYTFADNYVFNDDGTSSDTFQRYWFGPDARVRVGIGAYPYLGISVSARIPKFKEPGVYIDPTSVRNAASMAPFTAAVAPGEMVTLSGRNLAESAEDVTGPVAPTQLNGVQVLVNGVNAAVTSVRRSRVTFQVPYDTRTLASLQVINQGTRSNTVVSFVNATAPGLYTIPAGGRGTASATHADDSPVTEVNPARVGETLHFYLVGLGLVNPPVADGMPAPLSPRAQAVDKIRLYVDGDEAAVSFAGLAANHVGLYQIDAVVPAGIRSGAVFVDVSGLDADTSQAYFVVASGSGTESVPTMLERPANRRRHILDAPGKFPISTRTGVRAGMELNHY